MSEIDDLIKGNREEAEKNVYANRMLSLTVEGQKTREDILLEALISNEEQEKFFSNVQVSSKNIVNLIGSFASSLKEMAEAKDKVIDTNVVNIDDFRNTPVESVAEPMKEVVNNIIKEPVEKTEFFDFELYEKMVKAMYPMSDSGSVAMTQDNTAFKEILEDNSIEIKSSMDSMRDVMSRSFDKFIMNNDKFNETRRSDMQDSLEDIEMMLSRKDNIDMSDIPSMSELIDATEDMATQQMFRLKRIDENIEELVTAYIASLNEDVGTVSHARDTKDDKGDDSSGLFSNIMTLLPGGKALKGFGKFLAKFGKFGKALAGIGKLAGKLAWPLAIIMGIVDFFTVFTKSDDEFKEMMGMDPSEEVGMITKIMGGISGILSGLTLGLIDTKSIFNTGAEMWDSFNNMVSDLLDPEGGPLGRMTEAIVGLMDSFDDDGFLGAIKYVFDGLLNLPSKIADMVWDMLPEPIKNLLKGRMETITSGIESAQGLISDMASSVGSFLGFEPSTPEAVESVSTTTQPSSASNTISNFDPGLMKAVIGENQNQNFTPMSVEVPNKTMELTKEANKPVRSEPQVVKETVVVQAPAKERGGISRKLESADMSLAALNAGVFG